MSWPPHPCPSYVTSTTSIKSWEKFEFTDFWKFLLKTRCGRRGKTVSETDYPCWHSHRVLNLPVALRLMVAIKTSSLGLRLSSGTICDKEPAHLWHRACTSVTQSQRNSHRNMAMTLLCSCFTLERQCKCDTLGLTHAPSTSDTVPLC